MKVLTVLPLNEEHKKRYQSISNELEFNFSSYEEVTEEEIGEANIIIGNVPPEKIKGSKNLKWLQLNSAGTDGYLDVGVLPEGAILTNATGAYGLAISEHMVGNALMLMKRLHQYHDNMKQHVWKDEGTVNSIWNSNTLVVGLGDIGSEFAKKMNALGSNVYGIRRNKAKKPEYLHELHTMEALDELLPMADIVALTLPGTKELYHLFDKERFSKMKKGSILLNVGRGMLIDEEALCDALTNGTLYGAGIDVTEVEPLSEESRLWDMENLILTPHISGQFHLQETLERIITIGEQNLSAFLQQREMVNIVDFSTGYRKFIQ